MKGKVDKEYLLYGIISVFLVVVLVLFWLFLCFLFRWPLQFEGERLGILFKNFGLREWFAYVVGPAEFSWYAFLCFHDSLQRRRVRVFHAILRLSLVFIGMLALHIVLSIFTSIAFTFLASCIECFLTTVVAAVICLTSAFGQEDTKNNKLMAE